MLLITIEMNDVIHLITEKSENQLLQYVCSKFILP